MESKLGGIFFKVEHRVLNFAKPDPGTALQRDAPFFFFLSPTSTSLASTLELLLNADVPNHGVK
jgi:hypothetical protein